MLTCLAAHSCYEHVSGGCICLGSLISSGPGSHSVLTRASRLALLLNMTVDVEVPLSPHFSTGSLGKSSGASRQESHMEFSAITKYCSTEEQICGQGAVIHMQFVN